MKKHFGSPNPTEEQGPHARATRTAPEHIRTHQKHSRNMADNTRNKRARTTTTREHARDPNPARRSAPVPKIQRERLALRAGRTRTTPEYTKQSRNTPEHIRSMRAYITTTGEHAWVTEPRATLGLAHQTPWESQALRARRTRTMPESTRTHPKQTRTQQKHERTH